MNKIEFVSVDEQNKHYSVRTSSGHVYVGREYLDSCFLKRTGNQFDLHLDLERAEERVARRTAKFRKQPNIN